MRLYAMFYFILQVSLASPCLVIVCSATQSTWRLEWSQAEKVITWNTYSTSSYRLSIRICFGFSEYVIIRQDLTLSSVRQLYKQHRDVLLKIKTNLSKSMTCFT